MNRAQVLLVALAALPTALLFAALIGLGIQRRGDATVVALTATLITLGPALALVLLGDTQRHARAAAVQLGWSALIFLCLPVYFPGERREAVAIGVGALMGSAGGPAARMIASTLPDDPELSVAQNPMVRPVVAEAMPDAGPLEAHEIALPYEGEGRRLSVPVVFEHHGRSVETFMMLDTGATYTTLPPAVLAELDLLPGPDAPTLTLHTANGLREAQVVLSDRVWLGDLEVGGVAITTCDDCGAGDTVGLLGLNVVGGYNLTIDADRHEVIFSARAKHNRRLDVRPFTELGARYRRLPTGRVELTLDFRNRADRPVLSSVAKVSCGPHAWEVDLIPLDVGGSERFRRRLPPHEPCDGYQVGLASAWW